MYKCPHCEVEIDQLLYQEDATIYGTFDIETQDYEQNETEGEGGLRFRCPECDEIIDSVVEDLINTEEEERTNQRRRQILMSRTNVFDLGLNIDEEERELPIPPAINQEWRGEYSGFHNSHDRQKQLYILVCSKCGSKNEALDNEEIECYHCNKKLNKVNAKKIIPIENN